MSRPPQRGAHPARLLVVTLVALGLLARLTPGLMMSPAQAARLPQAGAYLWIARSVADGQGFVLRPDVGPDAASPALAHRMPGYPLLVGMAKVLLDAPARATLVVQAVCGAGAMALAAWMAHRLAGPWSAVVATALLAFAPLAALSAALFTPVTVTSLALTAAAGGGIGYLEAVRAGRRAWPWAAGAGLALAAAVYLEVWTLALAPVALAAAALSRRRRRLLGGWAVAAAVALVALSPWLVRNAVRLGAPVLVTDAGRALYAATDPSVRTRSVQGGDCAAAPPEGLDEVGRDVFYLRRAAGRIAEAPGRWLLGAAGRAGRLWSPALPAGLEDGPLHPAAVYTSLLPAAVLALVGLWALRRRAEAWWLMLGPVAVTGAQALAGGWTGTRTAVMPALAVLAGAGLVALLGRPGRNARAGRPPAGHGTSLSRARVAPDAARPQRHDNNNQQGISDTR